MNTLTVRQILLNPYRIFAYFSKRFRFEWMPDKMWQKLSYRANFGKKLNLTNPKTFSEKLQWLKLHDRKPMYTAMVDKYEVRKIVANSIGEKYLIPLIGVWDSFDAIDFDMLPNQFVLKCTHDSGGLVICKDKSNLDMQKTRDMLVDHLSKNYYWRSREWQYRNVKPRIIAEKYMVDESGTELKDYKFFTFGAKVKLIEVDIDSFTKHKRNFYTPKWDYIDMSIKYPNDAEDQIKKPDRLNKMIEIAEILAKDTAFLRVDLYEINGNIYFGELTLHHDGGHVRIMPDRYAEILGSWIELPKEKRMLK